MIKHVLITGGAGFIGSFLTESLLHDGIRVSIIDDLSTGSLKNLESVKNDPNLRVEIGDIISSKALDPMIREADCVVHLAAAVGVELVVHDPVRTIMTNVQGSEKVLHTAAETGKRCLIASTSEVYGKSTKSSFAETDDLLIGPSTHSRWSYACSKLLDEFMLMAFCRTGKLPGTVVRFFNTVGPRQTGRYGMVIPRFVSAALKGDDIRVYGSGEQTRCFCHVSDTVRAVRAIMEDSAATGEIFNIGSTRKVSIRELADLVKARTASKSDIVSIPYSAAYEQGFEDMLHRAPDVSKIKARYGWQSEISLEQIIDDVAASLRSKNA